MQDWPLSPISRATRFNGRGLTACLQPTLSSWPKFMRISARRCRPTRVLPETRISWLTGGVMELPTVMMARMRFKPLVTRLMKSTVLQQKFTSVRDFEFDRKRIA